MLEIQLRQADTDDIEMVVELARVTFLGRLSRAPEKRAAGHG